MSQEVPSELPNNLAPTENGTLSLEVKEPLSLRLAVIQAIEQRDVDALVLAMQEMRRYLFSMDNIEHRYGKEEANRRDTKHISDGHWKRSFEQFFTNLDRAGRDIIEVYLDGVSRIFINVSREGIQIFPSSVSTADVKRLFRLLELDDDAAKGTNV